MVAAQISFTPKGFSRIDPGLLVSLDMVRLRPAVFMEGIVI
jgi:hypothetical protein